MKIGLVTDTLPEDGLGGGIGTATVLVANELARRNVDTHVFKATEPGRYREYHQCGVTYHLCPGWISIRDESLLRGILSLAASKICAPISEGLALRYFINRAASDQPFDLMEFPEFGGWAIAGLALRNVRRTYVRLHSSSQLCRMFSGNEVDKRMLFIDRLEAWTTRHACGVSAPTLTNVRLTGEGWSQEIANATVIPNPVEPIGVEPGRTSRDRRTVLFTGRLERRKGIHILAEAIPNILDRVPDAAFRIFGPDVVWPDGQRGSEVIQKILQDHQVDDQRVQVLGRQPRSRILAEVKMGGIVVVPSLYESFAITVIEAMACGTPVIASDLAALRETIRSEDEGLLFRAGDPDALADQAVRVMTDETEWNRLSLGGVNRSRDFAPHVVVDQLLRAWGLSNGEAKV
jgi:glycosyltransferase involved in cell wall biosynthesis